MKLKWLGGAREVGRNGVLLKNKEKILFDYGVRVNKGPPKYPFGIHPLIDAIMLTHAHIDHSGFIPWLYHEGCKAPVFLTPPTLDLTNILLEDFLKLSKLKGYDLFFKKEDLEKFLLHSKKVEYGKEYKVGSLQIKVLNAGHIPGSCKYLVKGEKNILYTGDAKATSTRLLEKESEVTEKVDILIMESTYSYREHPVRKQQEIELVEEIKEAIGNRAIALIPVFAVGRAQEVMLILKKYGIKPSVWLDGMSIKATKTILNHPNFIKNAEELMKAFKSVIKVRKDKQRRIAVKKPGVIVTTSGMLQGGPVEWYISKIHEREECKIIPVGFQADGSVGKNLLDTGRYITENLNLKVNCFIENIDLSAHSGRSELLNSVKKINPEKVFVIHGDNCENFADELSGEGFRAFAPENGEITKI